VTAGPAEYVLRRGDYTAVVTARGAALRSLTHQGRDLVVPFDAGAPLPDSRGINAVPWPNRIADGRYSFGGAEYQLPVNEPERGCALHGLAFDADWAVREHQENSVVLVLDLGPAPGYPFRLRLEACYRLDDGGLVWGLRALNTGDATAPYGACPHPYLMAGPSPLDEWTLEVAADTFLEVTPDRLLPLGARRVEGSDFDFRRPRRIGAVRIDHAFSDLGFDGAGSARLVLRDPAGTGVAMEWDTVCHWLQLHTADKEAAGPTRLGLAVEPMTCPPDAFNSGAGLVRLAPGASHSARWRIAAVDHLGRIIEPAAAAGP
jgi:aldose 1-epimerase